VATSVRLTSPP